MIGFPRVVLAGAVDYAGLFPPASLPMPEVVAHYASYRAGPDAWALGRLVVPAARLAECVECAARHLGDGDPWRISALVPDPASLGALADFNVTHGARMLVDAAEGKAGTPEEVDALAAAAPAGITVFVELAVNDRLPACLARLKAAGLHAKIRTGGVVASAIPPVEEVVRFMRACHEAGVAFKATAGLHHPLRGEYPLTYAADAPHGTMHGYLNAFAAAGALARGATDTDLREILSRSTRSTEDRGVSDNTEHWASLGHDARRVLLGFGSCSFREPLDELVPLGLAT
jgi:hypothetical protein